MNCTIK